MGSTEFPLCKELMTSSENYERFSIKGSFFVGLKKKLNSFPVDLATWWKIRGKYADLNPDSCAPQASA